MPAGLPDPRRGLAGGLVALLLLTAPAAGQEAAPEPEAAAPSAANSETVLAEADAALNAGETDRAIALYTSLLDQAELPIAAYPLLFVRRGAAFSTKGDLVEAMADFDSAAELAPDDPDIRFYRGVAYLQSGDPDKAVAELDRAIEDGLPNAAAYAARARAHFLRLDLEQSRLDVEAALRLDPQDALALAGRGEIALSQGRYRDAVRDLSAAIESQPALAQAYRGRIAAHEALGQWDQVKPDLARLYEMGDRSPQLLAKAKSYGVAMGE